MKSITRETTLRLALFTSLGLLPLACGGTAQGDPDESSGGSSHQGGRSAKGGSDSAAGGPQTACTSPQTDPTTGLVSCAEGYAHRPLAKQCGLTAKLIAPPGGNPVPTPLPRADGSVECSAETADSCAVYQFGYCRMASQGGGPFLPTCQSGCVSDSDCGADQACLCSDAESPTGGSCTYVVCRTDSDCPGGNLCASAGQTCGSGTFACQTAQDTCASNADCGEGVSCIYGETGDGKPRRQCGSGVVCGRPFLVEHAPRLAAVIAGGAWADADESLRPRLERLTPAERAAQAEHWSFLGQMEHASIAAFARFSLQLLSLAAPPELVTACTQALADETAHTQLCFQLASAYAGRALGPGPLDVQRSLEQSSLEDVVELVIAEGCFGETRAALEALEAADSAEDPVIRAAYARIAADEERHAELAFRFVRWALEQGGDAVRARIEAALATAPTDRAAQQISVPCLAALT